MVSDRLLTDPETATMLGTTRAMIDGRLLEVLERIAVALESNSSATANVELSGSTNLNPSSFLGLKAFAQHVNVCKRTVEKWSRLAENPLPVYLTPGRGKRLVQLGEGVEWLKRNREQLESASETASALVAELVGED